MNDRLVHEYLIGCTCTLHVKLDKWIDGQTIAMPIYRYDG